MLSSTHNWVSKWNLVLKHSVPFKIFVFPLRSSFSPEFWRQFLLNGGTPDQNFYRLTFMITTLLSKVMDRVTMTHRQVAFKNLGVLNRAKEYCTSQHRLMFYKVPVRPHAEFCAHPWTGRLSVSTTTTWLHSAAQLELSMIPNSRTALNLEVHEATLVLCRYSTVFTIGDALRKHLIRCYHPLSTVARHFTPQN